MWPSLRRAGQWRRPDEGGSTRNTQLNDAEANRVAAKSKRGRKPAWESRSAELRQRVAQWKLTPPAKRQPVTLSELARELGIRPSLAGYYARQIPNSADDLLDQIPAVALVHLCPGILDTVVEALHKHIEGRGGGRRALRFLKEAGVFDSAGRR